MIVTVERGILDNLGATSAKRHVTYVLFDHLALRKGQNAESRKGDYLYITVNIVNLTKYVEVGGHGDQ